MWVVACSQKAEADSPYKAKMLVPVLPTHSTHSTPLQFQRPHDGGRGWVGCPLNDCHDLLADEDEGGSDRIGSTDG